MSPPPPHIFDVMTLNLMGLIATVSIKDTEQKDIEEDRNATHSIMKLSILGLILTIDINTPIKLTAVMLNIAFL